MRALLIVFLASLTCCISTAQTSRTWWIGANAPPSPARVEECRGERSAHSDWVIVAGAFGLVGTGTASSAALLPSRDDSAKVALGVAGAASAALSGIAALFVSQAANDYAQDDCQAVLSAPERAP